MNNLNFVNILFLILFSHLIYGQAATIPDDAPYQKLEDQFEIAQVSAEQLFLFEKKGVQHLKDFLNLIQMISSKEMDEQFLNRFETAAIKYFSSPQDSILFFEKNEAKTFLVKSFIKDNLKKNPHFDNLKVSNIESSTPIFDKKQYNWTISFQLTQNKNRSKRMMATMILKKEKKKFGKTEKEIWEVFLEKIEEVK